jgi:hypothetical protein
MTDATAPGPKVDNQVIDRTERRVWVLLPQTEIGIAIMALKAMLHRDKDQGYFAWVSLHRSFLPNATRSLGDESG